MQKDPQQVQNNEQKNKQKLVQISKQNNQQLSKQPNNYEKMIQEFRKQNEQLQDELDQYLQDLDEIQKFSQLIDQYIPEEKYQHILKELKTEQLGINEEARIQL